MPVEISRQSPLTRAHATSRHGAKHPVDVARNEAAIEPIAVIRGARRSITHEAYSGHWRRRFDDLMIRGAIAENSVSLIRTPTNPQSPKGAKAREINSLVLGSEKGNDSKNWT